MIISNSNTDDIKIKFNPAMIDCDGIIDDQHIHIPYNDKALIKALKEVILDIASRTEWLYPDFENPRVWIVVYGEISNPDGIGMNVEVKPVQFTKEERENNLKQADKESISLNYHLSECSLWEDIFEEIDDYYDSPMREYEDYASCDVKMTKSEVKLLQNVVMPLLVCE